MRMPWELAEEWKPGDPVIGARSRFGTAARLRSHIGRQCPYCNMKMHREEGWNGPRAPSRDHRVPTARGGTDASSNILICCRWCNEDKGSLTEEEYHAVRAGRASRLDHIWNARRSVEMNEKQNAAHRRHSR